MTRSVGTQDQQLQLPDGQTNLSPFLIDHPDAKISLRGGGVSTASATTPQINVAVFTSSGNWTVPAGVTYALVELVGAGGGGGSNTGGNGIYGAGGGYGLQTVTTTPGNIMAVTVGAGGSAGTSGGAGGSGGTTTFGGFSATGGSGGPGGSTVTTALLQSQYTTATSSLSGGNASGCTLSIPGTNTHAYQTGVAYKYSMAASVEGTTLDNTPGGFGYGGTRGTSGSIGGGGLVIIWWTV